MAIAKELPELPPETFAKRKKIQVETERIDHLERDFSLVQKEIALLGDIVEELKADNDVLKRRLEAQADVINQLSGEREEESGVVGRLVRTLGRR
jgi:septal ring factor EnvC (AmiA/AmiB activator)